MPWVKLCNYSADIQMVAGYNLFSKWFYGNVLILLINSNFISNCDIQLY